jgi:hypothetical protein
MRRRDAIGTEDLAAVAESGHRESFGRGDPLCRRKDRCVAGVLACNERGSQTSDDRLAHGQPFTIVKRIWNELMTTQLTYLVAQQKVADLTRSAERARLAESVRPSKSASRRRRIARLLISRRHGASSHSSADRWRLPLPGVRHCVGARAAPDTELGQKASRTPLVTRRRTS